MFASGAVIGLLVGGAIIQALWMAGHIFTIIPIAIALLIVVSRFIHVRRRRSRNRKKPEEQEHGRLSVEMEPEKI